MMITYSVSPETIHENWNQIRRNVPSLPQGDDFTRLIENLTGPIRKSAGVMGGCTRKASRPLEGLTAYVRQAILWSRLFNTLESTRGRAHRSEIRLR
jgi:hypothetical protein